MKMRAVIKKVLKPALLVAIVMVSVVSCQKDNVANTYVQNPVQMTSHQLGCLLLPSDLYMSIPLSDISTDILKAAPTVVNLNTPPVGDQGGEGSCVAWGTTYAGRSIMWQVTHAASWDQTVNIFSPEYVYDQIKVSNCASGAYVTDGLKFLQAKGVVPWSIMPYSDANGCSLVPTTQQAATALTYKTSGYSRVSITSTAIKAQLAAGKCVVVAGPVNSAFMYLAANTILKSFTGRSLGGHCYCVVGYDDSKQAFKFQNSWGTSWASAGFGWISYSYVTKWWQEAYVINN